MKKKGVLFLIFIFVFVGFGYGLNFEDITESDFSGTYNNTFYNSSGFIQLNNTLNGTTFGSNTTEMNGNESGLVAYWRFNESVWNGTNREVKDFLGKNNGTAKNANTSSGLFGGAGNFSGTSGVYTNEVQILNSQELNPQNDSFTITGWAKSSQKGGANQWHLYVAKRTTIATNGYYVGMLEGSGLNFMIGDGAYRYDTRDTNYIPIAYDQWFHFAAVINRTSKQILLYINGTLGASRSFTTLDNISNTWNLSIGNDEGQAQAGYNYPVKGQIDEVAFWNRTLNSSEIFELYQKGNITNSTSNSTYFYFGDYESNVKDASSIVQWLNISWAEESPYAEELSPNNFNTAGNVFLGHLNEASGTIIDYSGNGNNGTQFGGVTYNTSGKFNSALSFDGSNDYIDLGNSNSVKITGNLTLSAWVKFNQIPTGGIVMDILAKTETGGYGILSNYAGSGRVETFFYIGGYKNAGVSLSSLSAGNWYYIVGTYNGSSVDFYLNGIKQQSVAASGSISDITYNLTIGANPGPSYAEFFNGTIDEIAIFNRSLSDSEILSLYQRGIMDLKFQVRTSNDNSTWTEYKGSDGTSNTYYPSPGQTLNLNSKYIQYKSYFERNLSDYTPKLYNVTLNYDNFSSSNVVVTLDSPINNYLTNEYNINITCSASSTSELTNITPYYNKFGWMASEPARGISGTSNTTLFTLSEISSSILWNCYACNVEGNCSFANLNKTIVGDILAPTINLVSPSESYIENSSSTINFIFNASDNRATSLNCKLLVNGSESANNSSVLSGVDTTLTISLSNGNYTWKINCSDGVNYDLSEERNLSVNISSSYTPFWAKANTHTHTTNSDGDSSPTTVVNLYKSKGYSILAITDHGYVTNCTPFTNLSEPFLCVNSEEWTSTKHITRINISAPYNNAAINLQNAVNAAIAEGGFAVAAHPNWSSTIWTVSELTSLQNYTAMEIYNKVIERLSPDPYAVQKWDDVLKTGKKVFGVAADDMHQINVDLGYGWTKVYMPEFTKQAYVDSMNAGYFYASQGPSMDSGPFTLTCDGEGVYHMGQTANCSAVSVNATISSTNSSFVMRNISLIKDGVIINITNCSSQNCTSNYSENVSSSGYYRIQGIDSNNKYIWSNPIWVNKIALPVTITINFPENNSNIIDYTPLLNVSLNQQTSLWYNLNGSSNLTLCSNCSSYVGYLTLQEGSNPILIYANNSDNIVKSSTLHLALNFNKSISDSFEDNSSIFSIENVYWDSGKMSLGVGNLFGNFILKPINTLNNITGFSIQWTENNTENARGEGQREPIVLKYKINNSNWIYTNDHGEYITNGTTISGLNGNNFSIMFDFEKNNDTPIDLLDFRLSWTEFTIPLILNVGKSSITSSSAVISWNTDLSSNSSVLYGMTSSLGQVALLNDSVTNHSITLIGLSPAQGYSFRVVSCTASSCARYPQEPYTPDSFTTQQIVSSSSSSSSGGGGGGGGSSLSGGNKTVSGINNLELQKLSNLLLKAGDTQKLNLRVRNAGTNFLNDCKLKIGGGFSSWFNSGEIKSLSPGEIYNFEFTLKIPKQTLFGSYNLDLTLECKETNASGSFSVEVIEEKLKFTLIELKRQDENYVKLVYTLQELFGVEQNVELQFLLSNSKGSVEVKDNQVVPAFGEGNFGILIPVNDSFEGALTLLVNLNSETYSGFVQEEVILGAPVSGFALFGDPGKVNTYVSIGIIILFCIFAFFKLRNIFRHKKELNQRKRVKVLKKSNKDKIILVKKKSKKRLFR